MTVPPCQIVLAGPGKAYIDEKFLLVGIFQLGSYFLCLLQRFPEALLEISQVQVQIAQIAQY